MDQDDFAGAPSLLSAWLRHCARSDEGGGQARLEVMRGVARLWGSPTLSVTPIARPATDVSGPAFEQGRRAGRRLAACAGACPYDHEGHPAERWSWLQGFGAGRKERAAPVSPAAAR